MLLTRAPLYRGRSPFSCDLHVLSAPLTFVLSQDQTLQLKSGESVERVPAEDRSRWLWLLECGESLRSGPLEMSGAGLALFREPTLSTLAVRRAAASVKVSVRFSFQGPREPRLAASRLRSTGTRTLVARPSLVKLFCSFRRFFGAADAASSRFLPPHAVKEGGRPAAHGGATWPGDGYGSRAP